MKKIYFIILIALLVFLAIFVFNKINKPKTSANTPNETPNSQNSLPNENQKIQEVPLSKAGERVIKKPFGIKVSPNNSPISPERFSGYHTGVDFEIFSNEENVDVEIFAICSGKLLVKRWASGYGGVLVQSCELENQAVTVIYGHIQLSSIQQKIGDYINKEDKLAILGAAFSYDTDGERKHLHLGIHKGADINILGYVQTQSELKDWIDFQGIK